ncbi:MAG: SurA N-terminal domain-containing protein [Bacteroidales bacterium]|nr:SurA N-terminal domain-containing protein [Bacteroidales bacterium]
MATLEKIRSKSVFLIIVIGVALLAFIIGDALTNSRNILGDHTTVAKVGGTKIDYTDYLRQRETLNNKYEEARRQNPDQMANFDMQLLPQMALDQLIQETVLNNASDKAGIRSSANLLRYYMLENPRNQNVMELMQSLQGAGIAAQTPAQAYDIIFNPKRNGLTDAQVEPLQRAWLAAEKETETQIRQMIYQRLLMGTVRSNELDRKALYNDYVTTQQVDMAYLPFGNLTEKEYPVSEKDLKAAYEKEKKLFAVDQDTRDIAFIAVTVNPSDADRKACSALADQTVKYMSENPGALSKEIKKEGVSLSHHALRASDIPAGALKDFVVSGTGADSVSTNNNVALVNMGVGGFTVVRRGTTTTAIDSIQLNIVSTATEDLGKKVMAALNGGLKADSLINRYSTDSVSSQLNQWIPLYTADGATNAISTQQLDSLRNAGGRFIALQSGPQGALLAQVVKQNAPVTIYDYEEASYVLGPSNATMSAEREKLEKFLATNNDASKFIAAATKAGYSLQEYTVTASTPAIPRFQGMNQYYPDSRQVMRWIMIDAEENTVSHIYESKNPTSPVLYAAAVKYIYDDFKPMRNNNVRTYLSDKIRREKAGDKLAQKFSKNTQSLQSAAGAMGVNVTNIPSFRFGHNAGVNDAAVTGKISGTQANKKVILAKGLDGIYVYQVMGTKKENFPFNDQMYEQQYNQLINMDWISMLIGTGKVKNNIYKFEGGD